MARSRVVACFHWHPFAAYLYVLHLDGSALAWEYLRRNPDYRLDWYRHRRHPDPQQQRPAQRWGLRLLEDPLRDARDAQPDWLIGPTVAQLHPDTAPARGAVPFGLWGLPGHKQLHLDGQRLRLAVQVPARKVRLTLAPTLQDGMAYTAAAAVGRAGGSLRPRGRVLADELASLLSGESGAAALARERPSSTALQEVHTLQALDGVLTGASLRDIAQVLFGVETVAADWHADGYLRARVRRLVRRGEQLMRGDFRRLLAGISAITKPPC